MNSTFKVVDDFDLLGRLRRYNTDDRASTFAYDGTKRLGDNDAEVSQWKRYHWCQSQLMGYEDGSNTYYIVPDMEGSTKIIIDSSQGVVNRLDYDHLGNLRNQTAAPQVELLWRKMFLLNELQKYIQGQMYYDPALGKDNPLYPSYPDFFPLCDVARWDNCQDKSQLRSAGYNCFTNIGATAIATYIGSLLLSITPPTFFLGLIAGAIAVYMGTRSDALFNFSSCVFLIKCTNYSPSGLGQPPYPFPPNN